MENRADSDIIFGRGPVEELLRNERPVEFLYLQKGQPSGRLGKLVFLAREKGLPIKQVDARKLDELSGGENHQGVAALVGAAHYCEIEDIFARAGEAPPLIVLADKIEDPRNLGAIIRTAEAVGAHGLIIPKRRSAGLSGVVSKASAGASSHLAVARVPGLPAAIDSLKERGVWVYGADVSGCPYDKMDFSGPVALVLGGEGSGLGRLVREKCDHLVSLPMYGRITSLNVSVAAGVLLYEMVRQRRNGAVSIAAEL